MNIVRKHTKQKIQQEQELAKYHLKRFYLALKAEFHKTKVTKDSPEAELKLEHQLWNCFFDLHLGNPDLHKAVLYLQYATMMEQRKSFLFETSPLTYAEIKGCWYAIGKVKQLAKIGERNALTDTIHFLWKQYDKDLKQYNWNKNHPIEA